MGSCDLIDETGSWGLELGTVGICSQHEKWYTGA